MNKTIARYVLSILLILSAVWILAQNNTIVLFNRITAPDFLIATLIALIIFSLAGCTIGYLASAQYNIRMKFIDVLTLPLMMSFWSFLIPVRGAMLFSILFLKFKYKIRIVEGTSIAIYTYIISVVLIGTLGFWHAVFHNNILSAQTAISLPLMFCPLILKGINKVLGYFRFERQNILKKIKVIVHSIIVDLNQPWTSLRKTCVLLVLTVTRLAFRALWYFWAFHCFDLNVPLMTVIPFTLIMELTKIIRVSPGNLGLDELFAGGVFKLLGGNTAEGVLIALFLRISAMTLTFSLGSWCILKNMKYFNMDNLKSLWLTIKNA